MNTISRTKVYRLFLVCLVAAIVFSGVVLTRARNVSVTITVTNQTNRSIDHIYLSPPDSDNWGPDQLGDSSLAPGSSATITNASCETATVKVVAEDADGCFTTSVVQCSGAQGWTITNDAARNCGQ